MEAGRALARAKAQAPRNTVNLPDEYLIPTIASEVTEKLRAELDTLLKSNAVEVMESEAKAVARKMTEQALSDSLACSHHRQDPFYSEPGYLVQWHCTGFEES